MDPFVAEIRTVPFNFAPQGWALCNGQLLSISQNTALFSLLGTTYGGDGKSTFALPNLQGRAPMHPGQGPGLTNRRLGEEGGQASVNLLVSQLPNHNHLINTGSSSVQDNPSAAVWADVKGRRVGQAYKEEGTNTTNMSPQAIGVTGNGSPHNNMQPYVAVYYIIALQGVYPPRP